MNLYQPFPVRIESIVDETADTRTFRLAFKDAAAADAFQFKAGQFGEYSVFGAGESTFCIASPPTRTDAIECTFKAVGKATNAMRDLNVGDTMGFRGPYGNAFPVDQMEGHSVVFIAGGIGLAPVRCVIWNVLDLRERFKEVTIVYGARSVGDLVYKRELADWASRPDVKLWQTVDPGGETPDWGGEVGFVPAIVEKAAPSARGRLRRGLRPAHHDQVHAAGTGAVGVPGRSHLHHPREPHEVRHRKVWSVQHRPGLRLQGRTRLHGRAAQEPPARVLRGIAQSQALGGAPWRPALFSSEPLRGLGCKRRNRMSRRTRAPTMHGMWMTRT